MRQNIYCAFRELQQEPCSQLMRDLDLDMGAVVRKLDTNGMNWSLFYLLQIKHFMNPLKWQTLVLPPGLCWQTPAWTRHLVWILVGANWDENEKTKRNVK